MEVEKGIDIPPKGSGSSPPVNKDFLRSLDLKIGDSFKLETEDNWRARQRAFHRFYNVARRMDMKLSYRKIEGGIRVWRVG